MNLQTYLITPYTHQTESRLFDSVCRLCREFNRHDYMMGGILIGNYKINGVQLDALAILSRAIVIFEFAKPNGHLSEQRTEENKQLLAIRELSLYIGTEMPVIRFFRIKEKADVTNLTAMLETIHRTTPGSIALSSIQLRQIADRLQLQRLACQHAVTDGNRQQEWASGFYKELLQLPAKPDETDISFVYTTLNRIFRQATDQKLSGHNIRFAGMFAKVDYIIKEYGIGQPATKKIHETRHRLKHCTNYTARQLCKYYPRDMETVSRFIQAIGYGTSIPPVLKARFPKSETIPYERPPLGRKLRVIVTDWDEHYIYATEESRGEPVRIRYDETHSYMHNLLKPDARLNLLNPRSENEAICPELIIYEPDYLVDISAIAACFETYATSPYIHLLNQLKPAVASEAILLGNFAGQLLDEEVHCENKTYAQSIQTFFKKNALEMASCPSLGNPFHANARLQRQHIRQAIRNTLPAEVKSFSRRELMLEPSFFSEMLGIQGRMDCLQKDCNVLIEQKSGKGAFKAGHSPLTPLYQEKHYVQLLLYMALLHYNYGKRYADIHAFLLYSKYPDSLVHLGPAPQLLLQAIRLRNEITWCEYEYSNGGIRILDRLTPENLNQNQLSGVLWDKYLRPQLNSLLEPVHKATTLERAYYFRFLTFLKTEHLLSKIGNQNKENSGFASKWHDTLEDKKQAGNIFSNLILQLPDTKTEHVSNLTLRFSESEQVIGPSNFRAGDIVILYPYPTGHEPDVRQSMAFRASITDIQETGIGLCLRNPQTDRQTFNYPDNYRWAIEHDFFESSFTPLYKGMHAFLSAPQQRKDLLMTQRQPTVNRNRMRRGDYGPFNELVLKAKQAEDLFLLIGPPGTGKTSYGLLNIVQEELLEVGTSILLMAYTNRAVDEICDKLTGKGIDFIRIGPSLSCAEVFRHHLLENKVSACQTTEEVRRLIRETRIFCATASSLNSNPSLLRMKKFDLAVIDEASQLTEPNIIGLLCARCGEYEAIRKFIMIGDHKQLPAVVQQTADESRVTEPELLDIGLTDCRLSLFERLLNIYYNNSDLIYKLTRQGRMHREIAMFPNITFYQNTLRTVPCNHQEKELPAEGPGRNGIEDLLCTRRTAFLASPPSPYLVPSDKVNPVEAEMIAATAVAAYRLRNEQFDAKHSIGIIVPYRGQIAAVRKAIDRYGISSLHNLTIDTVERYQGSQRDLIIYGFTVQKPYQLTFLTEQTFEENGSVIDRRLNVAMTRARENLIIIGNPHLLSGNATFNKLITFMKQQQSYFEIDPETYCKGCFRIPPLKRKNQTGINPIPQE